MPRKSKGTEWLQRRTSLKREALAKLVGEGRDPALIKFLTNMVTDDEKLTARLLEIEAADEELRNELAQWRTESDRFMEWMRQHKMFVEEFDRKLDAVRLEEPPLPRRKPGSKEYRDEFKRVRVVANIPESLMKIFEADREKRGKNISQMFEYILHNYYRTHPPEEK